MAITGFGVTELNLIGPSGTPKIESPTNLNLNAVNVAISTNVTVGGTLGVKVLDLTSGAGTPTIQSPNNLNLNANTVAISTDVTVGGILSARSYNGSLSTKYSIAANGSSAYRFTGSGVLNSTDNPTLYFQRGSTYVLENTTTTTHPFELRVSDGGSAYAPGGQFLTGSTSGTQGLTVPMDAPVSIVYQCTSHAGMVGIISFR